MISLPSLTLLTSTLLTLTSSTPTTPVSPRQNPPPFVPSTLNNTQEFRIKMCPIDGKLSQYDGWQLEAYHTGAGLADPVFTSSPGTLAFLNSTNLQFDTSPYPFSASAFPGDTNYARWEPVAIGAGYGSGMWTDKGEEKGGIVNTNEEFDGWLVCEWFHGNDLPQLFQLIKVFDGLEGEDESLKVFPESCARMELVAEYF